MPRCLLAFEPPDGGVAENVLQLALGLSAHGWEPTLVGPPDAVIYDRARDAGVGIKRIPFERGFGHPLRDLKALVRLRRIIRAGDFDLVHVHSAKAGVLGRLAARSVGVPVLYSPHCFPFVGPWGPARRIFATAVERILGRVGDGIICVAEQERSVALDQRVAPPERLHVVLNGSGPCQPDLTPDAELEEYRGDRPLAACVTVLRPQKSVETFVDAAPAILERVPDAGLAVVGSGPEREALEQRAAGLGLDGRLRFFDFQAPAARQLGSIDVYVLPSAWEALPIAILESLACGVPQVATDVGATGEAVVDGVTGLLCPAGNPDALAARVADLLSDPSRRAEMSRASRERHARHFTVEAMVSGTAAVYDATLRPASSP